MKWQSKKGQRNGLSKRINSLDPIFLSFLIFIQVTKMLEVEWKLNKIWEFVYVLWETILPIPWDGFHTDCFLTFRNVVFTNRYVMTEQCCINFSMQIFFQQYDARSALNTIILSDGKTLVISILIDNRSCAHCLRHPLKCPFFKKRKEIFSQLRWNNL